MKKRFFALGVPLCILAVTACNNGASTTTTDSTSVTTGATQTTTDDASASKNITVHLDPSASYVDLKTGKSVKLRVDTVTRYVVDEVTNQPVMYYINPATNDTFDRSGRVVSGALTRGSSGDYSIDESRLSSGSNGNSSTGSSDTTSGATNDGTAASGNSTTKIKDDKIKQKTDTSTIKIKDNKLKIKTKQSD